MFAFISALSQTGGILIDKIALTRRRVEIRVYIPITFLFLVIFTGFLYPIFGRINLNFLKPNFLVFFLIMIICAILWNIFYYKGVQAEKVQDYELIIIFQPLLTILLAALFYPSERNIHIFVASIIASLALILAHLKKHHLEFTLGAWELVVAVVLMSVELIIVKELLRVYSPVALYFFRTGIVFSFFYFYFRPQINKIARANIMFMASSSILGTIQMISKFYGFEAYGIVYTSLILILSPILVYILSNIVLHERFRARTIISFVVILACIVYATVVGK